MATVNDKIKKILAMIDGATTEGEARAASLALQRLLVANDMTLDEISLSDDAPEINETGEDVGKRVAIWVKALAHLIVFQQFAHLLDSHRGHAHVATDDDGLQRLAGGYFEHLIVCQCEILIGRQSAFTCRRQSVIVTLHEA